MKVRKMLLREETEKVLHTKSNGDKLVVAASGDGYTAFTRDNVLIGHISAETDAAAVAEFSKKEPKYESMNEDYLDSHEYRIQRYEDDIPELFHRAHDNYMSGMLNPRAYADALARIYNALEEIDVPSATDESLTESYMDTHEGVAHVDTLDLMAALKSVVKEYGHMELVTPLYCELHDDEHGRRLELNRAVDENMIPGMSMPMPSMPEKIGGDININLDGSHSSVGFLGGTATNTNNGEEGDHDASNSHNEDGDGAVSKSGLAGGELRNKKDVEEAMDDDFMDAEKMDMSEFDSHQGKLEDIEFVMTEYIADSMLIEFVKKVDATTWLVGVEDEVVTVKFDPSWSEYVYTIEGRGPYSHSSYEYISRDVYDFVMANRNGNSADLDEDYGNDEMTEFLNWIQDYKGGCLWDAFTAEFSTDKDPDIDDVLNWLEDFNNDAYYDYIEKDGYDDDFDDLSSFKGCSDVKRADALYGVEGREDLVEAVYTDTSGIMGVAGETYTTAELRKIWNDNHNDDPSMVKYNGDYDKWVSDTLALMSRNDDVDEAFDMSHGPDLGKLSWQVASYLDVDALGEDKWIEFICDDPRDTTGGKKSMRFEAIGEDAHMYGFIRTNGDVVDVQFRNGSEAVCHSAEEVARFIAGEFGISI